MNIKTYSCSINLLRSLLWQDENTTNLQGLLNAKQAWYQTNHCDFWNAWVVDVFDLNTANDFGLSVWAVILDLPLYGTNTPSPANYPAFGFDSNSAENFGAGNFATDSNSDFLLTTEQRRTMLKLRAFNLFTRATIPEINRFLQVLFGNRAIYALDGLNMTMTYINTETLAPELRGAMVEYDLFPRPATVRLNFTDATFDAFGFNPTSQNFDNGNFIGG